jgi:hypothetical protein
MKMKFVSAAALLLLSAACRFGGPSGTATDLVEPVDDSGLADSGVESDFEPSTAPPTSPPASSLPVPSAGDAGTTTSTCAPPSAVPGCDPVQGTNCAQGVSQCVVDPGATEPAGRCVFSSAPAASRCDENGLYSTCPPAFTCKAGECRKYCYCDSDCDHGDTCSEPSGQGSATLFKLCMETRP